MIVQSFVKMEPDYEDPFPQPRRVSQFLPNSRLMDRLNAQFEFFKNEETELQSKANVKALCNSVLEDLVLVLKEKDQGVGGCRKINLWINHQFTLKNERKDNKDTIQPDLALFR